MSTITALSRPRVLIIGALVGVLTLLFFMGLILLSIFGHQVPCDSRYLVITVIAFGAALSAAFLGGAAAVRGVLPFRFAQEHPLSISASGGIAVLVVMLVLANQLFSKDCSDSPNISCPDTYQSFFVAQLRFGFCYPRSGWELDKGPIDVKAADIYLRNAGNRDIGVHFHVSLIPANYAGKYDDYTKQVANTWRQLDSTLKLTKSFVSGRSAYLFTLTVKDRNGISRPTEIMHIYLTSEKLLEVISTYFEQTSEPDKDVLARVRSSIIIEKF